MKMNFICLDKTSISVTFKPSDYPLRSKEACRSGIQYECGQKLKEVFPAFVILEDFPTPEGWYLDFYVPGKKIAVEVQGEQHYKVVGRFHKNGIVDLKKQQQRDSQKKEWCKINSIKLITVDDPSELPKKLKEILENG